MSPLTVLGIGNILMRDEGLGVRLMETVRDMQEWPERNFPMDLDINRGNILQLIEGSEKVNLPRPPRPNIIGRTQQEPADSTDSLATPPAIRVREPGTSLTDQNDNRRIRNVNTPPPEGPTGN